MISIKASIPLSVALTLLTAGHTFAQQGTTERVSVSSAGAQGNANSAATSISANGRHVAFESAASTLVAGDTNGVSDVFVRDRQTGQTARVSVSSSGQQGDAASILPAISADGRYVAFESGATNLVPGDANGFYDVVVHDRHTGQMELVSISSGGAQADNHCGSPRISADGRYVAFQSMATNLVPGDTNATFDVFVHDRATGGTVRASVSTAGAEGNGISSACAISADGRFVAFESAAGNLVSGDTNGARDVFVRDLQTGQTTRVSVSSGGAQGNNHSDDPSMSTDGRLLSFFSSASNLAAGDSNGERDVFVHDRLTGQTMIVSVDNSGNEGNAGSELSSISGNGRYVAFYSLATNLVSGDTNGQSDVFVHDRQSARTSRVSISSAGAQGNSFSFGPVISANGRFVAFWSSATNLVPGDTNGFRDVFAHQYLAGWWRWPVPISLQ